MANRPDIFRERALEIIEELVIMGAATPTTVMRNTTVSDYLTAKKYIEIAKRRIRNRYSKGRRLDHIRRKELISLDYMEKVAWRDYNKASINSRSKFLNVIINIKERRALLYGIDEPQKLWGVLFNKDIDSLKQNKLSSNEIDGLADKLMRIKNELINYGSGSEKVKDSGSKSKPVALRADLPAALLDGESADVSHKNNKTS